MVELLLQAIEGRNRQGKPLPVAYDFEMGRNDGPDQVAEILQIQCTENRAQSVVPKAPKK